MDDPQDRPKFEGTSVDLGEDLLENNLLAATVPSQVVSTNTVEQDELQKGEILMRERLFEDAKKVFRKLLRQDPTNETARSHLDAIAKVELHELLGDEAPRKKMHKVGTVEEESPESVLARLEKDLQFSIEKTELRPVPDLFKDETSFQKYKDRVVETVLAIPPRDRMDVGIAHLEMGLFEVAQAVFETVIRYEEHRIVGMYLFGVALICGGRAIEATIRIEPMARDLTLSESQKTDFLYLMGLAFERLSDERKAREFYRRVFTLNPKYRDVVGKLK